jgi:mercuric ion binding protein
MKSFVFSLTCLFVLFGCTQQPKPELKEVSTTVQMNEKVIDGELSEVSFSISGMMCKMGCAKTIETNLSKMEGVQQASVDFETSLATVLYNSSILQTDDLVQTVTKTGDSYTVSNMALSSNAKPACCAKKDCTKANCAKKKS